MRFPRVGKLEAARRQLETAALLYFNGCDAVSIHTLVAASYQILADLASKRGEKMMIEESLLAGLGEELTAELRPYMRKAQNFFKHGDRSDEPEVEYSPPLSELMLLDAFSKLMQLTGERPLVLRAYERWYLIHHPAMLKFHPAKQAQLAQAEKQLGGMERHEFLREFLARATDLTGSSTGS